MNAEVATPHQQVARKLSVGYQWLRSGQPARAQQAFEEALVLDPGSGRAHAWRAAALLQQVKGKPSRTVTERAARQRMREALHTETQEALRLSPDDSFVRYLCAHTLRQTGKPRRALELLEANIALQPDNAKTWLELARCRSALWQLTRAEAAARRAVECDPQLAEGHEVLGWVLERRGKRRESQAEWQVALQLNPESAGAHIALGRDSLRNCDLAQAEQHLSEGLRLRPESVFTQSQLSEVQMLRRSPWLRLMALYGELRASWKAKLFVLLMAVTWPFRNDHRSPLASFFWMLIIVGTSILLWRCDMLLRRKDSSNANPSGANSRPDPRSDASRANPLS